MLPFLFEDPHFISGVDGPKKGEPSPVQNVNNSFQDASYPSSTIGSPGSVSFFVATSCSWRFSLNLERGTDGTAPKSPLRRPDARRIEAPSPNLRSRELHASRELEAAQEVPSSLPRCRIWRPTPASRVARADPADASGEGFFGGASSGGRWRKGKTVMWVGKVGNIFSRGPDLKETTRDGLSDEFQQCGGQNGRSVR